MSYTPLSILLVEDDDVAVEAAIRNLKQTSVDFKVHVAANGLEALRALRGEGRDVPLPSKLVVLLDLNMPVMNGFEFLESLRSDPVLKSTVVFVLTTSDADSDLTRAYHNCIAGYMVKSALGPQFANLTRLLSHYDNTISFP